MKRESIITVLGLMFIVAIGMILPIPLVMVLFLIATFALAVLPVWPYSRQWGYRPIIIIVVVVAWVSAGITLLIVTRDDSDWEPRFGASFFCVDGGPICQDSY